MTLLSKDNTRRQKDQISRSAAADWTSPSATTQGPRECVSPSCPPFSPFTSLHCQLETKMANIGVLGEQPIFEAILEGKLCSGLSFHFSVTVHFFYSDL